MCYGNVQLKIWTFFNFVETILILITHQICSLPNLFALTFLLPGKKKVKQRKETLHSYKKTGYFAIFSVTKKKSNTGVDLFCEKLSVSSKVSF